MKTKFYWWTIILILLLGYQAIQTISIIPELALLSRDFLESIAVVVLSIIAIIGIIKRKMWGLIATIILSIFNIGEMLWTMSLPFFLKIQIPLFKSLTAFDWITLFFKFTIRDWIILFLAFWDIKFLRKHKTK